MEKQKLEQKIIWILQYINSPRLSIISWNLYLFSTWELLQILNFLNTGNLESIYDFLEDKKNEYLDIIQNLKIKKRYANLNSIKLEERLELEKTKQEIEIIDFNF